MCGILEVSVMKERERERKRERERIELYEFTFQMTSVVPTDASSISGECFWLCSFYDLPSLHTISTLSSTLPLINCVNTQQVRTTLAQIVAKIQNL